MCEGCVGLVVGVGGLVELVADFGECSGDCGRVGESAPAA